MKITRSTYYCIRSAFALAFDRDNVDDVYFNIWELHTTDRTAPLRWGIQFLGTTLMTPEDVDKAMAMLTKATTVCKIINSMDLHIDHDKLTDLDLMVEKGDIKDSLELEQMRTNDLAMTMKETPSMINFTIKSLDHRTRVFEKGGE